ncbi:MAG TPA: hypothetical protein VJ598_01495 [Albitalea sp.]|nr:hypothetical protein [Albitalea sp.]
MNIRPLRPGAGYFTAAGVALSMFALAFVISPKACEGGLELYFWSGVGALVLMAALPFATHAGSPVLVRAGWAFGLVVLGAATWFAGLFAANVRILCRLF